MENIGIKIKRFIDNQQMTLKEFAKKYDINISTLSKNINANIIPGGEILSKFIQAGLNINWLLADKGEMLLNPPVTETEIHCILRPPAAMLKTFDANPFTTPEDGVIYGCDTFPEHKIEIAQLLEEGCLLGHVMGNAMESYRILHNDIIVIRKLEEGETIEDELVIVHELGLSPWHSPDKYPEKCTNKFTLRFYDKKKKKLISGSKGIEDIDYDPFFIDLVPARISSVIRSLE